LEDVVTQSRRSRNSRLAHVLAGLLLVGSSVGSLQSCAQARAVSTESSRIDQVQLGFGLDLDGRVSPGCATSTFSQSDPIHLSLQVTQATAGSVVLVSVRDVVTHRIAWTEAKPVTAGRSFLTFEIGRQLAVGRYRAESTLGGETTSLREFVVHDRRLGMR
jgi:hypothetical protein